MDFLKWCSVEMLLVINILPEENAQSVIILKHEAEQVFYEAELTDQSVSLYLYIFACVFREVIITHTVSYQNIRIYCEIHFSKSTQQEKWLFPPPCTHTCHPLWLFMWKFSAVLLCVVSCVV